MGFLSSVCGKTPNYSSLRLFGCVCYVLLTPRELTKLAALSVECVFMGYSAEHKGYRCWDPVGHPMIISRDDTFDESCPFYSCPSSDVSSTSLVEPLTFLTFPDTLSPLPLSDSRDPLPRHYPLMSPLLPYLLFLSWTTGLLWHMSTHVVCQ